MNFSDEQIERYSRHIILGEVGGKGQEKIMQGKVLIIGVGGLGAPAALYLAAAGVGKIGLVDGDVVDRSNLQRQVIHFTPDIGKPKVISAREKINQINPECKVEVYRERATASNIADIIRDYDFIIDGTDNFPAKFLVNDACVLSRKAYSHGGILRFDGQTMTYVPGSTCYRCIFSDPPPKNLVPTCSQAGVLGSVAGILGTMQAAETLKFLIGKGDLLTDKMLIFNALRMDFRRIGFKRNLDCKICGSNPVIKELKDYEQPACDLNR
ncbi:MAG: adenylyltransferase [Candidatus Firestonebacteria bacterium RIFOXYC2_FULL_39_67]|nr:MAG: adenylyltransferase [Candidatus Firestonebacteria bacterium RIFOXYD2_FULL_39_29]OGF56650.1 MAG: adenylyltransferase [Candidatus Firestonebacteria bacterium RIFOXYC2_FULL_39_67]